MHICNEEKEIIETNQVEGQYRRTSEGVLIREWATDLSKPSRFNNDVPRCPYALQALNDGEVKTVVTEELWIDVVEECSRFCNRGYKVSMFFDYGYDKSYQSLEDGCMALNNFFTLTDIDIWLLSFLRETEAVVFVQRWSELENAAAKLEKLGYYKNYEPDEYERHILARKNRSI